MTEDERAKLEAELESAERLVRDALGFINHDENLTPKGVAEREVLRKDLEAIALDFEAARQEHKLDRISGLEEQLRRRAAEVEAEQLEREVSGNLSPADEELIDLREERLRREAEVETFGGCPECGKGGEYRNIYRRHFVFCEEHRITWSAGTNLFSSWREEDEEDWRETWEKLKGYRVYDPDVSPEAGPPLAEVTSLEALMPPPTP